MLSVVPTSFPVLYTVAALARVGVPAATVDANGALVAGATAQTIFRFPAEREITGALVLPEDGTIASLAALSLEILDEEDQPIFSDGIGDATAPRLPFALPCLSMVGKGFRSFPFQRFVRHGDRWKLRLLNSSLAIVRVAAVSLDVRKVQW